MYIDMLVAKKDLMFISFKRLWHLHDMKIKFMLAEIHE